MSRQYAPITLVLLLACQGTRGAESDRPSAKSAQRPNIILVMSDDQGYGDAGFRGHPVLQTPGIDALARDGLLFERFYAAAPVCSPTRGSCLTGKHPKRLGITGANSGHLPLEEPNLATLLGGAGYATGHFGKWHLGTLTRDVKDANRGGPRGAAHYAPPWERGFDVCFSTESKVPTWDPLVVPVEGLGAKAGAGGKTPGEPYGTRYWIGPGASVDSGLDGDDSRLVMDRALEFIGDAAEGERPFLSLIWFHAPHLPAIGGGEFLEPYADLDLEERHYYACLTAMDAQIVRLRARLDELGIAGDTMLWFASDNGPENKTPGSTAGLRARKRSLHEGGIRVPGLLVWPGRVSSGAVSVPASTSDYLPTILDVLGHAQPEGLDGISLTPWFSGDDPERGAPIGFAQGKQRAWTGDRFKLITKDAGASYALFDLLADPAETIDVTAAHPSTAETMQREFERWHASL